MPWIPDRWGDLFFVEPIEPKEEEVKEECSE